MLHFPVAPMKAVSGTLPHDDGWAYELKWDGYRTIAFLDGDRTRLQSTTFRDVSAKYPELSGLAEGLDGSEAIVDGEIVVLTPEGVPRFELLQRHVDPAAYVAFDLLSLDGEDLVDRPYEERRALLLERFHPGPGRIVPRHQVGDGEVLLEVTAEQGLEGIVAKRLGSLYVPGKRSPSWRKVKHRPQQELVVGGFTAGGGNRTGRFGALAGRGVRGRPAAVRGRRRLRVRPEDARLAHGPAAGAGHTRLPLRPPAAEELRPRRDVGATGHRRGGRLRRVDE